MTADAGPAGPLPWQRVIAGWALTLTPRHWSRRGMLVVAVAGLVVTFLLPGDPWFYARVGLFSGAIIGGIVGAFLDNALRVTVDRHRSGGGVLTRRKVRVPVVLVRLDGGPYDGLRMPVPMYRRRIVDGIVLPDDGGAYLWRPSGRYQYTGSTS